VEDWLELDDEDEDDEDEITLEDDALELEEELDEEEEDLLLLDEEELALELELDAALISAPTALQDDSNELQPASALPFGQISFKHFSISEDSFSQIQLTLFNPSQSLDFLVT
jgi:hypothetical protein